MRMGAGEDFPYIWSMAFLRAVQKAEAIEECTRIRSVDMQICPPCMNAPTTHPWAAFSRFASLRTIVGAFPPSSIKTGFKFLPACAAMILPTAVLPVKLIFLTKGCSMIAVVTSAAS